MTKNELTAIQRSIQAAKEIVEALGNENYPFSEFKDADLGKMFYELNDMCILLTKKIDAVQ